MDAPVLVLDKKHFHAELTSRLIQLMYRIRPYRSSPFFSLSSLILKPCSLVSCATANSGFGKVLSENNDFVCRASPSDDAQSDSLSSSSPLDEPESSCT